jgi:hypothetical protein
LPGETRADRPGLLSDNEAVRRLCVEWVAGHLLAALTREPGGDRRQGISRVACEHGLGSMRASDHQTGNDYRHGAAVRIILERRTARPPFGQILVEEEMPGRDTPPEFGSVGNRGVVGEVGVGHLTRRQGAAWLTAARKLGERFCQRREVRREIRLPASTSALILTGNLETARRRDLNLEIDIAQVPFELNAATSRRNHVWGRGTRLGRPDQHVDRRVHALWIDGAGAV